MGVTSLKAKQVYFFVTIQDSIKKRGLFFFYFFFLEGGRGLLKFQDTYDQ